MTCAGCMKPIKVGDRIIKATPSEFMRKSPDGLDDLMSELLGGRDGKVVYCEGCTQDGGRFHVETYYGEAR